MVFFTMFYQGDSLLIGSIIMLYSLSMDQDLRKLIEENNVMIQENLELARENKKNIQKIQLHIRRTMIGKWLYWAFVLIITASAFYLSRPYIDEAVDTYTNLKDDVSRSSEFINDPGSIFRDIGIVERFFGSSEEE